MKRSIIILLLSSVILFWVNVLCDGKMVSVRVIDSAEASEMTFPKNIIVNYDSPPINRLLGRDIHKINNWFPFQHIFIGEDSHFGREFSMRDCSQFISKFTKTRSNYIFDVSRGFTSINEFIFSNWIARNIGIFFEANHNPSPFGNSSICSAIIKLQAQHNELQYSHHRDYTSEGGLGTPPIFMFMRRWLICLFLGLLYIPISFWSLRQIGYYGGNSIRGYLVLISYGSLFIFSFFLLVFSDDSMTWTWIW